MLRCIYCLFVCPHDIRDEWTKVKWRKCQRHCNFSAFPNFLSDSFDSELNGIIICTFYHMVLGLEAGRMSWERHVTYIGGFTNAWSTYVSEIAWKKSDMNGRAIWQGYYIRCDFAGIILARVREQLLVFVNTKSCLLKTGKLHDFLTSFVLYTKDCAGCWVEYEKGLGYFIEISDWVMGWITKELWFSFSQENEICLIQ